MLMWKSTCLRLTTDTNPTSAISPAGNAAAIPVEDEASSLQGLGGYHGSVHPARTVTIYYSIGVSRECPVGH